MSSDKFLYAYCYNNKKRWMIVNTYENAVFYAGFLCDSLQCFMT